MKFQNVALASIGYTLPEEIVTSSEIEVRLSEVYERLRLPAGRLELMSGIQERRIWPSGTRISDPSVSSCQRALLAADWPAHDVGCLVHASVCREYLEPATACRVHHLLGLPDRCWIYDVSNACLGLLNGLVQIAVMIEAGIIRSGLVVGTESSRGLLDTTIRQLQLDTSITRQSIKPAFASLTIGSGSCALLLVDRSVRNDPSRILAAVAKAKTTYHELCHSDQDMAGESLLPVMHTDSERLLEAGIATGVETFADFLSELGWTRDNIDATVCHQVGTAHRRLMLQSLNLKEESDHVSFPFLGNTGSVALPITLGWSLLSQQLCQPSRTALLGIGSGINSIMIAADLRNVPISGDPIRS